MSPDPPPFALYNPAMLTPQVLLSEFTARQQLLSRLLDIIRANGPGEPPQHVLFIGARGMGKTTLLCAISASIQIREHDLRADWQPVLFDEESRRIGDLADFWLECIRQWEIATEPNFVYSHRVDRLLDKPGPDLEDQARDVFLKLVDESGKRAVLLIDNLNDVFAAIRDEEALLRLRSFLGDDSRVMIIGGATRWFDEVTDVDKPFFEFFRPFELKSLSLEEMRECLAGVAKARGDERVLETLKTRPKGVEALHLLTGGNPRLIRTFYRLLNEGMAGDIRQQLERLLDDYTPYHKAMIDALPPQQQRIHDAVALEWNPCEVATIAKRTRLASNQVSAQIKQLRKAALVAEAPAAGNEKRKRYLLSDRFSNIHYLMRHGRVGRLKMHWYVMTLRMLFDDDESFAESAATAVKKGLAGAGLSEDEGLNLARNALEAAGSEYGRGLLLHKLISDQGKVDFEYAEKHCRQAIEDFPNEASSRLIWGWLLHVHLKRYDEAEAAYRKAIDLDPKFVEPWSNLGLLLSDHLERHEEAEAAYRKAIDIDPKFPGPWNNLGLLLTEHFDRHEDAEAVYRKAIEFDPKHASPWINLAHLLTRQFKRHEDAENAYRKALDLAPKDAGVWSNLGYLLTNQLERHEEAEAAFRKAIDLDPKLPNSKSALSNLLATQRNGDPAEIRELAVQGLELGAHNSYCRWVFHEQCWTHADSLKEVLPPFGNWLVEQSGGDDEDEAHAFAIEMWLQLARLTTPAAAGQLLAEQPEEARLAFEILQDAFIAADDEQHLHLLAPERRAPVMKLLEKLES